MSKYFVVNPNVEYQGKDIVNKLRQEQEIIFNETFVLKREADISKLSQEDTLRCVGGKVIIKVDIDSKDSWTFGNGQKIEYKRRYNNFNKRQTEPVNAIVISSEYIPKGAEILVHQHSIHDSNRIFDYKDSNDNVRYYSIPKGMCFAYYDNGWKPLKGFDFGLRVFKPYTGIITGIEPELIKDTLYVTTGQLQGKVVRTLDACDFEIVFQDVNGREGNIIRFRPFGCDEEKREPEAIAILDDLTEQVTQGKILVGINISDAKTLKEYTNGKNG